MRERFGRSSRRAIGLVASAVATAGLLFVTGVPSSGDSPIDQPREVPNQRVTLTELAADSELATSITSLLPGAPEAQQVVSRKSENSNDRLSSVKVSTVVGNTGYEVTVYRVFTASELELLPRLDAGGASAWVGGDYPDVASVYYLTSDGSVGLRVASLSSRGTPDSLQSLVDIASKIAASDAVIEEVKAE